MNGRKKIEFTAKEHASSTKGVSKKYRVRVPHIPAPLPAMAGVWKEER
jgi:hypothetical protein